MKTIGVFANCNKPSAAKVLRDLSRKARSMDFRLLVADDTVVLLPDARKVTVEKFLAGIDLLMVFGGDGTMLRAIRLLQGKEIPVLGVNLGSLGYLTSVTQKDLDHAIECLAEENYSISYRSLLECSVVRSGREGKRFTALNDIVIERGVSSRIVTLDVLVDGKGFSTCMCDGLIVSTPTGSTGHSLSAGGPVVHPATAAFVITLICPHTLSTRPVVIPDEHRITIVAAKSSADLRLSVDGQVNELLKQDDRVEIHRSASRARFIHLPGYDYFSLLRQKLHWRGSTV